MKQFSEVSNQMFIESSQTEHKPRQWILHPLRRREHSVKMHLQIKSNRQSWTNLQVMKDHHHMTIPLKEEERGWQRMKEGKGKSRPNFLKISYKLRLQSPFLLSLERQRSEEQRKDKRGEAELPLEAIISSPASCNQADWMRETTIDLHLMFDKRCHQSTTAECVILTLEERIEEKICWFRGFTNCNNPIASCTTAGNLKPTNTIFAQRTSSDTAPVHTKSKSTQQPQARSIAQFDSRSYLPTVNVYSLSPSYTPDDHSLYAAPPLVYHSILTDV